MACSIVDADIGPPRFSNIPVELSLSTLYFLGNDLIKKGTSLSIRFFIPILESPISISHRLPLYGRRLRQERLQSLEVRFEDIELRCIRGIGDLLRNDGLYGKGGYFLEVGEEVEVLLEDGPLLVFSDVLEVYYALGGRLELDVLPSRVVREAALHIINYFKRFVVPYMGCLYYRQKTRGK